VNTARHHRPAATRCDGLEHEETWKQQTEQWPAGPTHSIDGGEKEIHRLISETGKADRQKAPIRVRQGTQVKFHFRMVCPMDAVGGSGMALWPALIIEFDCDEFAVPVRNCTHVLTYWLLRVLPSPCHRRHVVGGDGQ